MTGVTPVDNSVHSTVHLHPDTNRASFSQSYTNNGQQDTPERNENNPFQVQHNQTFHDENGIPSSLEDNNAQGMLFIVLFIETEWQLKEDGYLNLKNLLLPAIAWPPHS